MRSLYPNLLSLTEFTELMGLNPWRVAGFCDPVPEVQVSDNGCTGTWAEYTYQRNALSRTDVSLAIMEAEQQFAKIIGYYPAPKWTEAEYHKYPVTANNWGMMQTSGAPKSIKLDYNKIISIGKQACVKIGNSADITYSASPAARNIVMNGVDMIVPDTATATITVPSGANAEDFQVFFTDADRMGQPRLEWEIRPLALSVSGTTLTIKGKAWQFVKPELYEGGDCLYVLDTAAFVAKVEVWYCPADATDHGAFVWKGGADCVNPPCVDTTTPICVSVTGEKCPYVAPVAATWNEDTSKFERAACLPMHRAPDGVRINYLSGVPLVNGRMQRQHAQVIAMLAASYLECEICACNCTKERLSKYAAVPTFTNRRDVEFTGNVEEKKIYDSLENPLGQRYGQIQAWRIAQNWRLCN